MCCSEMLRRYYLLFLLAAWLGAWIANWHANAWMELRRRARSSRILVAAEFLDDSGEASSPFRVAKRLGATCAARPSRFSRLIAAASSCLFASSMLRH